MKMGVLMGLLLATYAVVSNLVLPCQGFIMGEKVLYPDMSCHQQYMFKSPNQIATINSRCANATYRQQWKEVNEFYCFKSCILSDMNIIQYDNASSEGGSAIYAPGEDTYKIFEAFESSMSLYQDYWAHGLADEIPAKCNNTIHQVANVQQLPCEQWDPIYDCVANVICEGGNKYKKFYPDFSSNRIYWYQEPNPLVEINSRCANESYRQQWKGVNEFYCFKSCVISEMKIVLYANNTLNSTSTRYYVEDRVEFEYNLPKIIQPMLEPYRPDLVYMIGETIYSECKSTILEIANTLPCDQWDPIYKCIDANIV